MAWNRESKRHAKAAKGISTRKDTRSSMAQASSNPKIQSAMTDKQYAQEEIEKYKNGHSEDLPEKVRPTPESEVDKSKFGFFGEQKFKAKEKLHLASAEEEAKELRTLKERQIRNEAARSRREEIKELESQEGLSSVEEKHRRLKREVHDAETEIDNDRLKKRLEKLEASKPSLLKDLF